MPSNWFASRAIVFLRSRTGMIYALFSGGSTALALPNSPRGRGSLGRASARVASISFALASLGPAPAASGRLLSDPCADAPDRGHAKRAIACRTALWVGGGRPRREVWLIRK